MATNSSDCSCFMSTISAFSLSAWPLFRDRKNRDGERMYLHILLGKHILYLYSPFEIMSILEHQPKAWIKIKVVAS